MTVGNCDPRRLRDFAAARSTDDERHFVEAHISVCEPCRNELAEIERLHDAIAIRAVESDMPTERREEARRHGRNVHRIVGDILKEPPASWPQAFAARTAELHTVDGVRALLDRCDDAYYNLPATRYLELATFAVTIAELASAAAPVPRRTVVAEALKEMSTALRLRGRYADALAALNRADSLVRSRDDYSTDEESLYAIAQLRFARAIILTEMERPHEAEADLLAAREHFRESNFDKYTATFFQEAAMLQRRGDLTSAITLFEQLISDAITRGHSVALSDLYGGIARCFAQAGEHWTACEYISRAKAAASADGSLSQRRALQLTWTLATSLCNAARYDEAYVAYEEARSGYYEIGYDSSAVKVEIDMALARRAADPSDDLYSYFVDVCSRAVTSGASVRAAHVLDELRELAARRRLSSTVLEYARSYLDDIASCPDLAFSPPANEQRDAFCG